GGSRAPVGCAGGHSPRYCTAACPNVTWFDLEVNRHGDARRAGTRGRGSLRHCRSACVARHARRQAAAGKEVLGEDFVGQGRGGCLMGFGREPGGITCFIGFASSRPTSTSAAERTGSSTASETDGVVISGWSSSKSVDMFGSLC